MSGYRALVRVLAMVDGERREFAPGAPLPALDARDRQALLDMQAIERDPDSSKSDAAPPAGGAGAAGGANAGTNTPPASEAAKGAGDSPAPGAGGEPQQVNVNTDTAEALAAAGLAEHLAVRLVQHREANGPFAALDDITRVSGIGTATLAAVRDRLTV